MKTYTQAHPDQQRVVCQYRHGQRRKALRYLFSQLPKDVHIFGLIDFPLQHTMDDPMAQTEYIGVRYRPRTT